MDEELLEAARAIRPYLADLAGEKAPFYDAEIARLLAATAAGADVGDELPALLRRSAAISAWVRATLADDLLRPPDIQPGGGATSKGKLGYAPLPGTASPVAAQKYCCPDRDKDFIWWRRSAGIPVPVCPTHRIPLVACG